MPYSRNSSTLTCTTRFRIVFPAASSFLSRTPTTQLLLLSPPFELPSASLNVPNRQCLCPVPQTVNANLASHTPCRYPRRKSSKMNQTSTQLEQSHTLTHLPLLPARAKRLM